MTGGPGDALSFIPGSPTARPHSHSEDELIVTALIPRSNAHHDRHPFRTGTTAEGVSGGHPTNALGIRTKLSGRIVALVTALSPAAMQATQT
jgi:hypothetical protein